MLTKNMVVVKLMKRYEELSGRKASDSMHQSWKSQSMAGLKSMLESVDTELHKVKTDPTTVPNMDWNDFVEDCKDT